MSPVTSTVNVSLHFVATKKSQLPASERPFQYYCPEIVQRKQHTSVTIFPTRSPAAEWRIWCDSLMLKDQTMSVVLDGSPLKAMQSSHTHTPQTALR